MNDDFSRIRSRVLLKAALATGLIFAATSFFTWGGPTRNWPIHLIGCLTQAVVFCWAQWRLEDLSGLSLSRREKQLGLPAFGMAGATFYLSLQIVRYVVLPQVPIFDRQAIRGDDMDAAILGIVCGLPLLAMGLLCSALAVKRRARALVLNLVPVAIVGVWGAAGIID